MAQQLSYRAAKLRRRFLPEANLAGDSFAPIHPGNLTDLVT